MSDLNEKDSDKPKIELPNGNSTAVNGSAVNGSAATTIASNEFNNHHENQALKSADTDKSNDAFDAIDNDQQLDPDYVRCGCSFFRPDWLQKFRTPIVFLINYSLMGILRGAYFHYTISSLSTIEKRYVFPSRYSSIILIADNVSSMIINPLVGYLGTRINGPKLIGCGLLICAISSAMSGLPFFIYGTSKVLLSESDTQLDPAHSALFNLTKSKNNFCEANPENCLKDSHPYEKGAFIILVIASFVNGVGYSGFWTIGLPYLDDNVKRSNSPIYISISTVIRMLGVTVGYFLSAVCLQLYEDPRLSPDFGSKDPRWIGAWWLGFIIIAVLMFIFTLPFFMFPPSMRKRNVKKVDKHLSFSDAYKVLGKLCRNPILVMDTLGGAIRFIGFAGYWINKPRYIEAQFHQSAAQSSFLTGATSILMKSVGILLGGVFMSKYRPSPRVLVSLIVVVEVTCNLLMFSAMFVGCPAPKFGHISYTEKRMIELECNKDCHCTQAVYQPICASDGITNYFNPCYAGCDKGFADEIGGKHIYRNCTCDPLGPMTQGPCKPPPEEECNALPTYLIILSLTGIISSFARTPNIMIAMRSVDKDHKSFAFGMVESFFSIFCYIPYPILFSFVTDAACIVWERKCGENGNCWVYDPNKFRYLLHGVSFAFMCVGTLFDIGIWFYADRLKGLYEEEEDEPEEKDGKKDGKGDNKSDDDTSNTIGFVLQDKNPLPIDSSHNLHELTTRSVTKSIE